MRFALYALHFYLMPFNYKDVAEKLIIGLSPRQKEVVVRRFGLHGREPETLQEIGDDYKVCRERIRQIQDQAMQVLQEKAKDNLEVFVYFKEHVQDYGGLRKEDLLLSHLGEEKLLNHIAFLLHLHQELERKREDQDFHTLWHLGPENLIRAKEVTYYLIDFFKDKNRPLALEDFELEIVKKFKLKSKHLLSFIEASKHIDQGPAGLWGLADWPEITPQSVRDRALIVFKEEQKPLHFKEVAEKINEFFLNRGQNQRKALPQTVHNELIKDQRFVRVGRGLYALKEWGFKEGRVKDILIDILKNSQRPLSKQEILEQVANQRILKENTVLLNLTDKKLFSRDQEGRYTLV